MGFNNDRVGTGFAPTMLATLLRSIEKVMAEPGIALERGGPASLFSG